MSAARDRALPAGTLTFVFTDIEGSTRLVQRLGEARFNAVLEDHGRLVAGAFDAEGGRRVRMEGDSFFYVFQRASAAVAADPSRASPVCSPMRTRIVTPSGKTWPASARCAAATAAMPAVARSNT